MLVAGYGSAGQYVTDFLLKDHRIKDLNKIVIMSRKSKEDVEPRIKISEIAAGISERYIPIEYHSVDFNDIDRMSNVISEVGPDVIVYTGRYASGLKYGAFSYPNQIGYGVWMPLSFPYIYKLMQAVKKSGVNSKVINTSFPDGVNYLLAQADLAPYTGAGNINHLVPRIKWAASKVFKVPVNDFDIDFVCSHYTNTYVSKEGQSEVESLLRIKQVTTGDTIYSDTMSCFEIKDQEIFPLCKDTSASGQIRNQMIATDCAEIVRYLIDKESSGTIHVPGFEGLPGGFRVKASNGKLTRFSSWSVSSIIRTNIIGLRADGVVVENSRLYFTEESIYKMKKVFNLEYPKYLEIEDIQKFADVIKNKLEEVTKS